jgi:hypothetical protein
MLDIKKVLSVDEIATLATVSDGSRQSDPTGVAA